MLSLGFSARIPFFDLGTIRINRGAKTNGPNANTIIIRRESLTLEVADQIHARMACGFTIYGNAKHVGHRSISRGGTIELMVDYANSFH